jgi:predicted  nucleic acid-binding Zn-ribbon protein
MHASESSDLGGLALVASALGNIVQASRNSELNREKDRLLDVLRAWQSALHRATAQVMDLRREVHSLREANRTLVDQVAQLEQESDHWESKYADVVRELDATKRPASTTAEVSS